MFSERNDPSPTPSSSRKYAWGSLLVIGIFPICWLLLPSDTDAPLWMNWAIGASFLALLILALLSFLLLRERTDLLRQGRAASSIAQTAFETSNEGIVVTDSHHQVLSFNQRFLEMWSLTTREVQFGRRKVVLQKMRSMVDSGPDLSTVLNEIIAQPLLEIEHLLYLKDGKVYRYCSKPIVRKQRVIGRIWFITDLTLQFERERKLERQQYFLSRSNEALLKLNRNEHLRQGNFDLGIPEIVQHAMDTLELEVGILWQSAPEKPVFECIYFRGWEEEETSQWFLNRVGHKAYLDELKGLRVLSVDRVRDHEALDCLASISTELLRFPRLDVPIRLNGDIWSVLSLQKKHSHHAWSSEEISFAASIADLILLCKENALRRKTELQLQDSVGILKSVFEKSGVGIVVANKAGEILDHNALFAEVWDLPIEILILGQFEPIKEYMQEQTLPLEHLKNNEETRFLRSALEHRTDVSYLHSGKLVETYTGKLVSGDALIGTIWYFRDITSELKSQMALHASEVRNRAIVEALPDMVLKIDAFGRVMDHWAPNSWSTIFENLDQRPSLPELFPEKFALEADATLKQVIKTGESSDFIYEMEVEGKNCDLEARLVRSGASEAFLLVRDLTHLKNTERELLQRNFELDSFVYRASHDLKAPLNSIMGLVNIMSNETLSPSLEKYLHMIDRSVVKLDTFIRNLAEFSRVTRFELKQEGFDLVELLDETWNSLQFMDGATRVERRVELGGIKQLRGDRFHLQIVLANLLSNAIKYQDHQKEAPFVLVTCAQSDQGLCITVEDNGIGISNQNQEHLFELFFRASNQSFGSGLGLYILKNALEKMKGTISLKSKEGKGTIFTVHLPFRVASSMTAI